MMYSSSGFWTQVRSSILVLTVIWNNCHYQTVRNAYYRCQGRMAASGHYAGMYLGDPEIDFVKLAQSQGVQGERVASRAGLEAALKRGIAATPAPRLATVPTRLRCEVDHTGLALSGQ